MTLRNQCHGPLAGGPIMLRGGPMTLRKSPPSGPMTLRTDRPISLVFKPETFQLCVDLAVTRKNAGNASYDLSRDRITDETAWRDLFREPDSSRPATGASSSRSPRRPTRSHSRFSTRSSGANLHRWSIAGSSSPRTSRDGATQRIRRPQTRSRSFDQLVALCAHRGGTPPYNDELTPRPDEAKAWWNGPLGPATSSVSMVRIPRLHAARSFVDLRSRPRPTRGRARAAGRGIRVRLLRGRHGHGLFRLHRPLCDDDYFGTTPDQQHDAEAQRRCWECAYDPT